MYSSLLDTFIAVADCGSFTKAAQHLYISSTAIMKQINMLERQLDLVLMKRTPAGICLTKAGEMIYQDAKFMIDYSKKSIAGAKAAYLSKDATFCIGTSLLHPANPFMDLWYYIHKDFADYKLHVVPFEDDNHGIYSEMERLGEKFDFLIGVCDCKLWNKRCNFLPLGTHQKMIAVSRQHRLAGKSKITLQDLHGETLMMVERGSSQVNDAIREHLEADHPQIKIENTPVFYDMSVFHRCAKTKNVLLTMTCWTGVHPELVTIPLETQYDVSYGLLYSNCPSEPVRKLVVAAKKQLASRN